MDFTTVKSLTIPEGEVVQISVGDTILWKAGHTNLVPLSTEADDTTIYNGGLGYKNGYRIRSGGAEGEEKNASHTGFIPLKAGDIVCLSGYDAKNVEVSNAINVYNSSHTNIGQIAGNGAGYGILFSINDSYGWSSIVEETTGVFKWVAPPDSSIAYMRVTGYTKGDGSKMIVTVNEEIS